MSATGSAAQAPRFVRRTQLNAQEYRTNFRQIDCEVISALISEEATKVTFQMSKIYLCLINAPVELWGRDGVLRFTGCEREGKWQQAAGLYHRAVEAKPSYTLAHFHLGRLYANQNKYAAAIEQLERSLEPPGPETPTFLYALAATNARAGARGRAVELMRQARVQALARGQTALVASIDHDLAALSP